jgi:hexosaminidase
MRSFILTFLVACISVNAFSQNQYTIIPEPQKLIPATGVYLFKSNTAITVIAKDTDISSVAKMLSEQLKASFDIVLPVKAGALKSTGIFFVQNDQLGEEAYQLNISTRSITIQSKNGKAAFYALQSLFQLMPAQVYAAAKSNVIVTVPACQVEDAPRFNYRGLMLDAGRHFYTVDFIKRFIDLMAV